MDSNSFAGHAPNQELEKEAMMMNTAALVSFLTSRGYSKEITPNLAIDLQDYLSTGNGAHGSEDNHKEGKPRLLASTSRGTKEREITKTKTNTKINASTNMNTNTNTDMIAHAHASTKTPAHTSSGTEGVSDLAIRVGLDRQTHVQHQLLSTLHNREHRPSPEWYEEEYIAVRTFIFNSSTLYKTELLPLLWPLFLHCYLQLISKGFAVPAHAFFSRFEEDSEQAFLPSSASSAASSSSSSSASSSSSTRHNELQRLRRIINVGTAVQPEEVAPRYLRRRVVVKMSQISYELFLSFCQDNRLMLILQIINQHVHIIITSHAPLIKSSSSSSATRKDGISSERTHRSKDKSDSNSKEAAARDGVQGSSGESGGASDEAHGRRRGANGEAESGLSGDNLSDPRKSGVGSMGGGRSGAGDRPAKDSAGNGTNHYNKSDDTNGMPGKEINSLPIRWGMLQDVADLYHSNHARQMSHSTSHSTSSAAAGATLTTEKGRTKDRQEGKGSSGGGSVDSLYTPVGRADKDKDQDKASSDTVERGAFLPKPDHKQHKRIKQDLKSRVALGLDLAAVAMPADIKSPMDTSDDTSKSSDLLSSPSSLSLPSVALYTFLNTNQNINSLCLSDDGSIAAAGMGDSTVRLWDMRGLKSAPCCGTDTDKDCDDGGSSKRRRVDRNGSGSSKDSSGGAEATHSGKVLIGHQGPVFCLDMSTNHGGSTNDTQFVLSGGEDCTVKLWSCKDNLSHFTQTPLHSHTQVVAPTTVQGAPLLSYKGHNYPVWDVSFSPVGFYFASASMDSTCRLWSTDRVYPLRVFTGHSGDVEVVEFHPNSNYLATGGSDGTVRVWDIQSGKCVRVLQHHGHRSRHAKKDKRKSRVTSLAFSPFGRYLASGCDNGVICMWDIGAGTLVDKYIGHTRSITSLSFSRDMHHHSSAVACIDSESDSDAPRSTLNQHLGSSGGLLASASLDCTIKLWSSSFSADPSSSSLSPFSQSLFSDSQIVSTVPAHFPSVSLAIGQSADQILLADDAAKGVQSCPSLVQTFYSKSTPLQYLAFTPRNLLVTAGVFSK